MRRTRAFIVAVALAAASLATTAPPAGAALSLTPDDSWMTNGKLYDLDESGGVMYLGGKFKRLRENPNGQPGERYVVENLAAIDATTGVGIPGFRPRARHATQPAFVRAVAASPDGTRLYVGGRFDSIDGTPVRNLAAIDLATGQVDPAFAPQVGGESNKVFSILVSDDGSTIYVGGAFTNVNGTLRRHTAAFGTDGSLLPWFPKPNRNVRALAFDQARSTVFLAGAFDKAFGQARQSVARVDAASGSLHDWAIPWGTLPSPMTGWSLTATGDRLFGGFGRGPNFAQAFRLDNGNTGSSVWKWSTVGNVQEVQLSPSGSQLFVGGHFGTGRLQQRVCNQDVHGLLVMNPSNGLIDCSWIPKLEPFGNNFQGVWDIELTGSHVWFAGKFTEVGDVRQQNVARVTR